MGTTVETIKAAYQLTPSDAKRQLIENVEALPTIEIVPLLRVCLFKTRDASQCSFILEKHCKIFMRPLRLNF